MKKIPDLHITESDFISHPPFNFNEKNQQNDRHPNAFAQIEITCFDVAANEIGSFRWQKGSENSVHQNTLFLPFLAGQLIFLFISLILLAECRISLQFEKAGTGFLFFFFYFFCLKYYFIRSRLKKKKNRLFAVGLPKGRKHIQ